MFDKTGTITGTYNISSHKVLTEELDEPSLWELISVVERDHLQHPVGFALYQESLRKLKSLEKPKAHIIKENNDESLYKYFDSEGIVDKGIEINGKRRIVAIGNQMLLKRFEPGRRDSKDLKIDRIKITKVTVRMEIVKMRILAMIPAVTVPKKKLIPSRKLSLLNKRVVKMHVVKKKKKFQKRRVVRVDVVPKSLIPSR